MRATCAGTRSGVIRASASAKPALVEQEQLAIGEVRPVTRRVEQAGVDAGHVGQRSQRIGERVHVVAVVGDRAVGRRLDVDVERVEAAEALEVRLEGIDGAGLARHQLQHVGLEADAQHRHQAGDGQRERRARARGRGARGPRS